MKVLSMAWAHETNTFCVVETNLDSFKRQTYLTDPKDIYAHAMSSPSALGATYEAAEAFGWELSVPVHATANPSGKLTDEVFELICGQILSVWDGSFDGALLHLHGAMVSCSYQDCEGELLRRMREKHAPASAPAAVAASGTRVPIVVTLDLHGNITQLMADTASALIAVKTYPHIDYYERAVQGAGLLQRAMQGEIELCTVFAPKLAMLKGLDGGRTQSGPMRELIDRADAIEQAEEDVLAISICAGFTAADIYDIGPSITVTVNVKQREHENEASAIASANGSAVASEIAIASASGKGGDQSTDQQSIIARAEGMAAVFMAYAFEHRAFSSVSHVDAGEAVRIALEVSLPYHAIPLAMPLAMSGRSSLMKA
jgi:microcystin degradation protein MlrC